MRGIQSGRGVNLSMDPEGDGEREEGKHCLPRWALVSSHVAEGEALQGKKAPSARKRVCGVETKSKGGKGCGAV